MRYLFTPSGGSLGVWQTHVTSGGQASFSDYVFAGGLNAFFGAVNPLVAATRAVGSLGGYYGAKYFGASESQAVMAMHIGDIGGGLVGGFASTAWNARAQFNVSWGTATREAARGLAWDFAGLGGGAVVGLLAGGGDKVLQGAQAGMNIAGMARSLLDMMKWVCFAPETQLLTPDGWKRIDQFRAGDTVVTAPEDDPTALPVARLVEEVFENRLPVVNLHVGGQVVRTTLTHPFYVRGQGWVPTAALQPGDQLRSHDGQWVAVEEVVDDGEESVVYNLRVAEHHTYFVGGEEWGFSVWAHNNCRHSDTQTTLGDKLPPRTVGSDEGVAQVFQILESYGVGKSSGMAVAVLERDNTNLNCAPCP
ncbi:MAG: hypothetical protein JNM56_11830 [Planctomycetia bacterium]|nr:hypothetical protein [Planctomycetia bacterium]